MEHHIQCETCDCDRTYSGPAEVGDAMCESCGHALRSGHKFQERAGATDPETGVPIEFYEVPTFY